MNKLKIIIASIFLLVFSVPANAAKELIVDLSKSVVAITTGFIGSDLLLFGTTEGEGDIVVVVRGPAHNEIIRHKKRIAGIWVNDEKMTFRQVPSYYAIASNRPIEEFLSAKLRKKHQIGVSYLKLKPSEMRWSEGQTIVFRQALIRNKYRQGLYGDRIGNVVFLGNRLFRTQLHFPSNVNVGTYGVDVYLVRDGEIASIETTLLTVRKFGFEAEVYNFAHSNPAAYGIVAIIIAAMAGWAASAVFRKA